MKPRSHPLQRVFGRTPADHFLIHCLAICTAFMLMSSVAYAKPLEGALDNNPPVHSSVLSTGPLGFATVLPSGPCDLPLPLPYLENFEAMPVPGLPTCWTPRSGDWSLSDAPSISGLHALSGTKYLSVGGAGGATIWSPGLTLEAAISYDFACWHATNGYLGPYPPGMLQVELYVNTIPNSGGAVLLGSLSQAELTKTNFTELRRAFVPPAGGTYYFGIYVSSGAGSMAFDDLSVSPTVACAVPTAFAAANITDHAVDMSWVASASNPANGYQWEVRTSGAPGTGSTGLFASGNLPAGTTSVTLGGLQSDTQYAIYVRGDCSGILSPWAGSVEIITHCEPHDLPYLQDFSSISTSGLPACMRRQNFGINSWGAGQGQGSMSFKNYVTPQPTWLFTNGLNLTEGHSYQLQYSASGGGSTMLKMRLAIGTDATQGGMSTVIHDHTSSPTSLQTFTWNFTANTTGVHYIGFNAYDGVPLYAWELDGISVVEQTWDCEVAAALPYHENFEDAIVPGLPNCMSRTNSNNPNWVTQGFNGAGMYGNWAVALPRTQVESYPYQYLQDWLFTPRFSLVGGTEYTLSYLYSSDGAPYTESMFVAYGMEPTVGGMVPPMAVQLVNHSEITNTDPETHVVSFTPTISGIYYIGFAHTSALNQGNLYLDDIRLQVMECLPPTGPAASNVTANSAKIGWTPSTSIMSTGYNVEVRTSGAPGSGDTGLYWYGNDQSPAAAYPSFLKAEQTYTAYVRTQCGTDDWAPTSEWTDPITFTPEHCPPSPIPYSENFEGLADPSFLLPPCMGAEYQQDNLAPRFEANGWVVADLPQFDTDGQRANSLGDGENEPWLFTAGLSLTGGTSYTVSYRHHNFLVHLVVAYGTEGTAAGMTTQLAYHDVLGIGLSEVHGQEFTPATTGTYYIGFRAEGAYVTTTRLSLDEISVVETPPQFPAPEDLNVPYLVDDSGWLTWTIPGDFPTNGFQWEVRTNGLPGSGNIGLATSGISLYSLGDTAFGLLPNTNYFLYVRSDWGNGAYSTWAGPHAFTTQGCTEYVLEFQSGANSPNDVSYEVLDAAGTTVLFSGTNPAPAGSIGSLTICLPNGCYTLRVTDPAGDGIVGYALRRAGATAADSRVIDNLGNFSTAGVSAIGGGPNAFCLPMSEQKPIFVARDKMNWVNNEYFVCEPDQTVSDVWLTTTVGDPLRANSGYQFWFFDPNGDYSYRRGRTHSTSDNFGPADQYRACHMKINNWAAANQIPTNRMMNVRVRTRVNGVYGEFGPAYKFMIDPVAAACPRTKLNDIPDQQYMSCNSTRTWGGSSLIHARQVSGANKYQFRFRMASENFVVAVTSNTYFLKLNWTTNPLQAGRTYDVDVRASKDGGVTWCAPNGPSWGESCTLTITGQADGNSQNMSLMNTSSESLSMWPNPNAGDQLYLDLRGIAPGVEAVAVDIYDMTGKRIVARMISASFDSSGASHPAEYSYGITQDEGRLNTVLNLDGDLAKGMYLVNITAGNKRYTERLVIAN